MVLFEKRTPLGILVHRLSRKDLVRLSVICITTVIANDPIQIPTSCPMSARVFYFPDVTTLLGMISLSVCAGCGGDGIQDNTPGIPQGMNPHSVSYVPQSSRRPGRRKASPDSSNNAAVAAWYGGPVPATAAAAAAAAAKPSAEAATMAAPSVPNPEEEPKGRTVLARRLDSNLGREATEKTTGAPSGRK